MNRLFSLSPEMSEYCWQWRWYWTRLNGIKSEHWNCLYLIKVSSINWESTVFQTFLNINKKWTVYFHYHLKCQNITDNESDIEFETIESSQNTGIACNVSKCHLFNENGQYFKNFLMWIRNEPFIFIIKWNVRILLTMKVILNSKQ